MSDEKYLNSRKIHDGLSAYEKFHPWINFEVWTLMTEAIPLILGYAPEFYDSFKDESKDKASYILDRAKKCSLSSLPFHDKYEFSRNSTPEDPVDGWRVDCHKFLLWAVDNDISINKEFLDAYNHVNIPIHVNEKKCSTFRLDVDESQFMTKPNLERLEVFNIAAIDAYDYFWKRYSKSERNTIPKAKKVVEYLKENYRDTDLTNDDFERIQVLIRHPDTYKGGK